MILYSGLSSDLIRSSESSSLELIASSFKVNAVAVKVFDHSPSLENHGFTSIKSYGTARANLNK